MAISRMGKPDEADEPVLIRTMCPTEEVARTLAREITKARLASAAHTCQRRSFYWWEEQLHECEEWELRLVTRRGRIEEIEEIVEAGHPYELPELIAVPVLYSSDAYAAWIGHYTR